MAHNLDCMEMEHVAVDYHGSKVENHGPGWAVYNWSTNRYRVELVGGKVLTNVRMESITFR